MSTPLKRVDGNSQTPSPELDFQSPDVSAAKANYDFIQSMLANQSLAQITRIALEALLIGKNSEAQINNLIGKAHPLKLLKGLPFPSKIEEESKQQ